MSENLTPAVGGSGVGKVGRKPHTRLAPPQKYEVFSAVLANAATQRELAEKYRIDRSTIQRICKTAKQATLEALAAAAPGRPSGTSPKQAERTQSRERMAKLEKTIAEQAMQLHLIEGKVGGTERRGSPAARGWPGRAGTVGTGR